MIVTNAMNRSIALKNNVLETIYKLYDKETIKDIVLLSKSEGLYLWVLEFMNQMKYSFYTNREGQLLFDGILFECASPFSKGCAWVKSDHIWYILNVLKNECVEIPNQITWKNIRPMKNGNIAIFNPKNVWGSIYYNSEEHTFEKDIPFIWDALEISRDGKEAIVGMCNENNMDYQIKLTNLKKEEAYNYEKYKTFLKKQYLMQKECMQLVKEKSGVTKEELCMPAYPFYPQEQRETICTNKESEVVETIPIAAYTRILGRAIK